MRAFRNGVEALKEIERELFEMGITNQPYSFQNKVVEYNEDFLTKELIGYSYSLSNFDDILSIFPFMYEDPDERERVLEYCYKEFLERISKPPVNPGKSWKERPEVWEPFLNDKGMFDYTYSERMSNQISKMITMLLLNPGTRQAVMPIYDRHLDEHLTGGRGRIPCSMYYQFIYRKIGEVKELTLIYTMRSCDFYTHFPIDMYLAIRLLNHVGAVLNANRKKFIHFIGSLHAYKKDYSKRRIF